MQNDGFFNISEDSHLDVENDVVSILYLYICTCSYFYVASTSSSSSSS